MRGWGREVVTCGCLSSGKAGLEAAGVVSGYLVGSNSKGLVVTCGCLSSVEDGVEAVSGRGSEVVTCGCLSSVEEMVGAAGVSEGSMVG